MSARRGLVRGAGVAAALLLAAVTALPAVAADAGSARERGAEVYQHRCAMCHAEGQTGTFVLARRLGADRSVLEKRKDLIGPYIRQVVRYGLMNMPRISRVELPDADLDAVIVYLAPQ